MSAHDLELQRRKVQQEVEYLQKLEQLHVREQQLAERERNPSTSQQMSSSNTSKPSPTNQSKASQINPLPHEKTTVTSNPTPIAKTNYLNATDGTRVIHDDPWLEPCKDALIDRYSRYLHKKKMIEQNEGGLLKFSEGYKKFGFNRVEGGIQYREWAPNAQSLYLMGEFNDWNRRSHEATRDEFGVFSLFLADKGGHPAINHRTKVKTVIITKEGEQIERIPAWIKVVWQEKGNIHFDGVYWEPEPFQWKHQPPITPTDLRIYECHVGMSSAEPKISTYIEFARDVLPYVAELGYNAIQLMAIMEHSYYASFGYQVSNFFAISSRFGTPEELKGLIDRAHELGISVLLDIVHSHASKNVADGINRFDGSDHQYFHEGAMGNHPIWDSRLFNYGHWEVLRFLMSNARWYIEEYHFDGFRFDGVTSMIYKHHGVAHAFVNGYDEYFNNDLVDNDAVTYLTLVNDMLHQLRDKEHRIITISEEVSGMATMCRPISEGGMGFDYRLAMGIPDKWIELVKGTVSDENWNVEDIVHTLINRRYLENTIAYAESHDQALVGDKTIAFWLMDAEMYTNMSVLQEMTPVTSRGMALHKMIRLITNALGGEGYLNFMGNEFGHPEWIDFPRAGNNDSYHYARRRFDLAKDPLLRYHNLLQFDKDMQNLEKQYHWLSSPQAYITIKHNGDKVVAFERGNLFWVFNFHSTQSFTDYGIGISVAGKYKIILDSDAKEYGGHQRITKYTDYFTEPVAQHGKEHRLLMYLPCRSALVFALDDKK